MRVPFVSLGAIALMLGVVACAGKLGVTFAPISTFADIIPRIVLAAHGIQPDRDLRSVRYAGFADEVAVSVYRGECDAGVA